MGHGQDRSEALGERGSFPPHLLVSQLDPSGGPRLQVFVQGAWKEDDGWEGKERRRAEREYSMSFISLMPEAKDEEFEWHIYTASLKCQP